MACNEGKTIINGRNMYAVQMNPMKAVPLQLKLVKILGAPLGVLASLMKDFKDPKNFKGVSPDTVTQLIGSLFESADENEVMQLIVTFVSTVKIDGELCDINTHFQGAYMPDLYKVFIWVLGVNYSDFFGENGLDGFLNQFKTAAAAAVTPVSSEPKEPAQT